MAHNHHGTKNIKIAFFLNLLFTIAELIGGYFINSVAIVSDAIHDLGDTLSIGMSWFLHSKSEKSADKKFTLGYRRFSLLGALINSLVLISGSFFVITESIERLIHPEQADAKGMLIFAIFGVAINGYAAWRLKTGESMNEKVLSWHLLEDVLGWTAIFIGSVVMYFWDIPILDPILSLMITVLILYNAFKNLKKTMEIFLEKTPANISVEELKNSVLDIPEVESIHQMHIWSLDGEHHVFSAHVCYTKSDKPENEIREIINTKLDKYKFEYTTIQLELISNDTVDNA